LPEAFVEYNTARSASNCLLCRSCVLPQSDQCTPQELAVLLPAFNKIATAFRPGEEGFKSPILNEILAALPMLKDPVASLLNDISLKAAKEGNKDRMWTDPDKYPDIEGCTVVRHTKVITKNALST
jgi:DNA mismatch repair protein MSH3